MIDRECFVPAPWPGHYQPLLECGQMVRVGQAVGLLHDFYRIDDEPWPVHRGGRHRGGPGLAGGRAPGATRPGRGSGRDLIQRPTNRHFPSRRRSTMMPPSLSHECIPENQNSRSRRSPCS